MGRRCGREGGGLRQLAVCQRKCEGYGVDEDGYQDMGGGVDGGVIHSFIKCAGLLMCHQPLTCLMSSGVQLLLERPSKAYRSPSPPCVLHGGLHVRAHALQTNSTAHVRLLAVFVGWALAAAEASGSAGTCEAACCSQTWQIRWRGRDKMQQMASSITCGLPAWPIGCAVSALQVGCQQLQLLLRRIQTAKNTRWTCRGSTYHSVVLAFYAYDRALIRTSRTARGTA